jgi:photosystem II stability/assembly factor-like uncharacterized protein
LAPAPWPATEESTKAKPVRLAVAESGDDGLAEDEVGAELQANRHNATTQHAIIFAGIRMKISCLLR